jgi:hypothetical protein
MRAEALECPAGKDTGDPTMTRLLWLSCCAAVALSLIAEFASAQETDDVFGPVNPAVAENPVGEVGPTAGSATEKSILAGAVLQPVAADNARRDDFCQCVGETNSESVARIEQALQQKLTPAGIDFAEAPLEEVVTFIQETYNVQVQLDSLALEEIGIGPDEPINTSLHGISLRSALRHMLKQLQLTYIIQDEVLVITTPEEAESQLRVCVYDVRDLIEGTKDAAGVNALIETMVHTVVSDSWAVNGGGEAAIRAVNGGLIVVSQTQAVHEEIRGLLDTIRSVKKQQPGGGGDAKQLLQPRQSVRAPD